MDAQGDIDLRTLDELLAIHTLRSADKANMVTMHQKLTKGTGLTYQERQNLWAYASRYGVQTLDTTRK